MAEIERLSELLTKCKTTGCTQNDLKGSKFGNIPIDVDYQARKMDEINKKYHDNGNIRFPDCGPVAESACFWQHYNQSGVLDFLSFFMYLPAVLGCAIYTEYNYNLCLGNFAYILVDAYSKKIAPFMPPSDWE